MSDIQLKDQYYLTRAQYNTLKNNNELIVGAQYYITDESYNSVSVSATGTATDEVGYITIDGVEKKIAGGGSSAHTHEASAITGGTFGGQTNANATSVTTLDTSQVRNITISTTDLTPGTSALNTGDIYFVYEV